MKRLIVVFVVAAIATQPVRAQSDESTDKLTENFSDDVFRLKGLGLTFRRVLLDHEIDGVTELFMSETEITNRMYKEFIDDTGKKKDDVKEYTPGKYGDSTASPLVLVDHVKTLWSKSNYPEGRGEHPVAFVTIHHAIEFADWLNVKYGEDGVFRLPLIKEWVWAAYGKDRQFPWGNTKRQNFFKTTAPVKSYPELKTPDGLFGMWGNVSELVHTRSNGYGSQDDRNIRRPLMAQWMGPAFHNRAQPRQNYWGYTHSTLTRGDHIGFRLAFIPHDKTDKK